MSADGASPKYNRRKWHLVIAACLGVAVVALIGIKWWSAQSLKVFPTLTLHYPGSERIWAMAISPDGTRLATCGSPYRDVVVSVWDISRPPASDWKPADDFDLRGVSEDSKQFLLVQKRSPLVLALEFTPDSRLLIAGFGSIFREHAEITLNGKRYFGRIGGIQFLDPNTLEIVRSVKLHRSVYGIALSPDGTKVAAIGEAEKDKIFVGVWKTADATEIFKLTLPGRSVVEELVQTPHRQLVFSHDGQKLLAVALVDTGETHWVSGSPNQRPALEPLLVDGIQVIDVEKQAVHSTWQIPNTNLPWIDLSQNDQFFATDRIWEIDDDWSGIKVASTWVGPSFRFLNDDKHGVCTLHVRNDTGCARITDFHNDYQRVAFRGTVYYSSSFSINRTNQWMAIGDQVGQINLWQIPDLRDKQ